MSDKLFHRALEIKQQLLDTKGKAFKRGTLTGFHTLDAIISFIPKMTTIAYAPPHVGKSVITLDILMAIAEREGKKIVIYSPEFRRKEEMFNSLIQTRLGQTMYGEHTTDISDEDFISALSFVDEHFVILTKPKRNKEGTHEKMTMRKIYSLVSEAQIAYGWKFDFLLIDPANFVDKSNEESKMLTQDYVLEVNDMMAEFSEVLDLHTIITAHTRDIELVTDKETGITYYPVPHPSMIMSGQSWYRAGYQIIAYWRCPEGVVDKSTGIPYPPNATDVICQKSKPFGAGKLGKTRLYFNPHTHRMNEEIGGIRYSANQYYKALNPTAEPTTSANSSTTSALKPSSKFDETDIF